MMSDSMSVRALEDWIAPLRADCLPPLEPGPGPNALDRLVRLLAPVL